MARRLLVLFSLVLLGGSFVVVSAAPAAADCSGPTIRPIEPVVRGETMTIEGYAWGDNCYDTGPPPAGQRTLGVPVPDIELYIVQGDREVLVARGSANDEYEFSVDVMVPPRLEPGPAQLVAEWGTNRSTAETLEILGDAPVADPPMTTPDVTFGSVPESTTTPTTSSGDEPEVTPTGQADTPDASDSDSGSDGRTALVVGGLVLVAIVLGGGIWWARRKNSAPA